MHTNAHAVAPSPPVPLPRSSPWERARQRGVAALATHDLLRVVLGAPGGESGSLKVEVPSEPRLLHMGCAQLAAALRIPLEGAVRVQAALELGRRAQVPDIPTRVRLASASEVAALWGPVLSTLPRERVVALLLDRKHRLITEHVVSEGWVEGSPVDPREVFRPALQERASGVIMLHNHPSGDPAPSAPDRDLTRRLAAAAELLGLRLVDHVVLARGGFSSLAAEGLCG